MTSPASITATASLGINGTIGAPPEIRAEKWAALLANAATGSKVLPAYAAILAELSPVEALLLERICDLQIDLRWVNQLAVETGDEDLFKRSASIDESSLITELAAFFTLSEDELVLLCENLARLRGCSGLRVPAKGRMNGFHAADRFSAGSVRELQRAQPATRRTCNRDKRSDGRSSEDCTRFVDSFDAYRRGVVNGSP